MTTDTWQPTAESLVEFAWGIITNAGHGDWTKETEKWQKAAARWRDLYHEMLDAERAR